MNYYMDWLKKMTSEHLGFPEVWHFNIDRLRLFVVWLDETARLPRFCELEPLNIWEFNADGSVFEKSVLIDRIADWVNRINAVYSDVESWSQKRGLTSDKSRTVLMSEELMQKFAIPDRELAILDISRGAEPMLSFVPVGLWLIGSNGRIEIISQHGTSILVDRAHAMEQPDWLVVSLEDKQTRPWNEETFERLTRIMQHRLADVV
jgi:hypothetical protein